MNCATLRSGAIRGFGGGLCPGFGRWHIPRPGTGSSAACANRPPAPRGCCGVNGNEPAPGTGYAAAPGRPGRPAHRRAPVRLARRGRLDCQRADLLISGHMFGGAARASRGLNPSPALRDCRVFPQMGRPESMVARPRCGGPLSTSRILVPGYMDGASRVGDNRNAQTRNRVLSVKYENVAECAGSARRRDVYCPGSRPGRMPNRSRHFPVDSSAEAHNCVTAPLHCHLGQT